MLQSQLGERCVGVGGGALVSWQNPASPVFPILARQIPG